MAFHQIREALRELEAMHRELARSYGRAARSAETPRVARMFRLIESEEVSVCESLTRFEISAPRELLDTWLQYMPHSNLFQIRRRANTEHEEHELDRIVGEIVSINEDLRKLYSQLASVSSAGRVQELFNDIESIQLAKISKIATSTLAGELVRG